MFYLNACLSWRHAIFLLAEKLQKLWSALLFPLLCRLDVFPTRARQQVWQFKRLHFALVFVHRGIFVLAGHRGRHHESQRKRNVFLVHRCTL